MRFRNFVPFAAALAASLAATGCGSDNTTAPTAAAPAATAPSPTLLGNVLGAALGSPTQVTPLTRVTPLTTSQTTSARIGPLGGVLALPGAGITVIVPPLAVTSPTTISVTARAGSAVAYDFAPHGIKFNLPLVVTQSLAQTSAHTGGTINPLSLFVGYYPDGNNITSVTELLSLHLDLLNQLAIVDIWHFSGYIFASGRDGGDGGTH